MADEEASLEIPRLTRYMWVILLIVAIVRFFFAYSLFVTTYAIPFLKLTFNATTAQLSLANAIVGMGAVASVLLPMAADRWGRKPIFLSAFAGISITTGITGLAQNLIQWTVLQTLNRFFLIGEQVLCIVIMAEEWPAAMRARGLALEMSATPLGGLCASLLLPLSLAQTWMGQGEGWRTMYLVGLLPIALSALFAPLMKETRRFERLKTNKELQEDLKMGKHAFLRIFERRYRRFLTLLVIAWIGFQVPFGTAAFTHLFTTMERNWTPEMISLYGVLSTVAGFFGTLLAGWMIDRIGRRWSALIIQVSQAVFGTLFCVVPGYHPMMIFGLISMFFGSTVTLLNVLSTEFFPTEIRGTGASWSAAFGRLAYIGSPLLFGYLTGMGFTLSEGLIWTRAPWYLLTLAILLPFLPETKSRVLEEIVEEEVRRGEP